MPVTSALGQPGCQRARQRVDRPLELVHLLTGRVHEVDVLRQRLAQRARHRLDTTVGDEPPPDLGFDQFLEHLEAAVVVLAGEALVERAFADLLVLLRALHHLLDQTFGVELPQRPVQVVRTADRSARLHPREARDRSPRQHPHLLAVHVHQRVEEHLRELLVRHLAHRAAGFHGLAQLLEIGALGAFLATPRPRPRAEHREVDLEHGLEHLGVAVVLHQRRLERGAERVAVLERDVLDRAHRVEVLGHRHRQAGDAQLVYEALEDVEHLRIGCERSHVTTPSTPTLSCEVDQRFEAMAQPLVDHEYGSLAARLAAASPRAGLRSVRTLHLAVTCGWSPARRRRALCAPW